MVVETDLVRGLREVWLDDEGMVGERIGLCCWRMRRSPDMPKPWSWSVMIELLQTLAVSVLAMNQRETDPV
jgi:hypothetical protein